MDSFPIDQAVLDATALGVRPDVDRATGAQKADRAGSPRWIIDVLAAGGEGRAPEVVSVKISASTPPTALVGQPVRFQGLRARQWAMEGRAGLSVSAERVEGPAPAVRRGEGS